MKANLYFKYKGKRNGTKKYKGKRSNKGKQKLKKTHKNIMILDKKDYTNTYYLDSCLSFRKEYHMDRLVYHLERLGLKPDIMMKQINQKDAQFIKDRKIVLKDDECYQNYRVPKHFDSTKLKPMFMFQFTQFLDKRFYDVNMYLGNFLNTNELICLSKSMIYFQTKDFFPNIVKKHMKKTFLYLQFQKFEFPSIYILRPINSSSGSDIFYVSNMQELLDAEKYYMNNNTYFEQDRMSHNFRVIASEYITNPLLYKTRKFHLRMYYLISYINNNFNTFFLENGKILTALYPFTLTKPFTKEVHDTHFDTTDGDILVPEAFLEKDLSVKNIEYSDIIKQMRTILSAISSNINLEKSKLLYDNVKNGFCICGVDFMIDDTGTVILIEVNSTPGLAFYKQANTNKFCDTIFNWVNECVLEPCFKGTDPTKHPTYLPLLPIMQ